MRIDALLFVGVVTILPYLLLTFADLILCTIFLKLKSSERGRWFTVIALANLILFPIVQIAMIAGSVIENYVGLYSAAGRRWDMVIAVAVGSLLFFAKMYVYRRYLRGVDTKKMALCTLVSTVALVLIGFLYYR